MPNLLLQCAVVLYRCSPDESRTLARLAQFLLEHDDLARRIALLIYDNSPSRQAVNLDRWKCAAVEYHHDAENGGLAPAYNLALARAQQRGVEWLVLLDQDTDLNPALFPALFDAITSPVSDEVCAIVPKLMRDGEMLSPQIVGRLRNTACGHAFSGIPERQVTALNSAACVRVAAVASAGGFAPEYRIEFLDHIMFHRLQAAGGRVQVLDVAIEHHLSITNIETEMGLERYGTVLDAEWRFVRETGFGGGPAAQRLRLLKRAFVQSIRLRNKKFARLTLRAAMQ